MEPNRFFFKLTALFLQYFLMILVLLPFIYFWQLSKAHFHPEEVYIPKILFLAIAIAMPFVVANAFAFAKFENLDLPFYLKASQEHAVVIHEKPEIILQRLKANLAQKPFWILKSEQDNSLVYDVKSIILTDRLRVEFKAMDPDSTALRILSKPRMGFIFLDYGRNYRNILKLLLATKPV